MDFSFLWLLLILPWIFAVFCLGKKWLEFSGDNDHKWWGGFPAWMTGYCFLGFIFFAGPAYLFSVVLP